VRLLVDYRESLVKDRTAAQNRLRWRLHELEPGYDPPSGSLKMTGSPTSGEAPPAHRSTF